jgi:hypothetical protein
MDSRSRTKELRRIRSTIACDERLFVEFKKELSSKKPEAICKEIAAFSTTNDGTIFVGVSNDKEVLGLENPKDVRDRIERWAYELVSPAVKIDAYPFKIDGKTVVVVEVKKGPALFYSYDGRLYGRFGTSSSVLKTHHIEEIVRGQSLEQAIAGLQANVASAQSQAILAHYATAPGIQGQGELATMQYQQIKDRIFEDLASSSMIAAINSGIAIAQSLASIAQASTATAIVGQGDLATTNYADLLARIDSDIATLTVIRALRMDVSSANASAAAASASAALATARAEQAIQKVDQLVRTLQSITTA